MLGALLNEVIVLVVGARSRRIAIASSCYQFSEPTMARMRRACLERHLLFGVINVLSVRRA